MDLSSVFPRFQSVGAELFRLGLASGHGGNLSARLGDRMVVTRHGCRLGGIASGDLVETSLAGDSVADAAASMELAVHRAIYNAGVAQAVVHVHPAHAIALSLKAGHIDPVDMEGSFVLGRVPVVGFGARIGPGEGAPDIAAAIRGHRAVVVSGHGCFAAGADLEQAADYAAILEESCRILWLAGR